MALRKPIIGGLDIIDATAEPSNVASGKVFYNNNGRQEGIWTPTVTDFIKDATATPDKVLQGEVFYNNEGRQEGIYVPDPAEIITDATALPSDVIEGKVFYNNEGRQVGIKPSLFGEITTLEKSYTKGSTNVYTNYEEVPDRYTNWYSIMSDGEWRITSDDYANQSFSYIEKIPISGKRLIGIIYNGYTYISRDKFCNVWFGLPGSMLSAEYIGGSAQKESVAIIHDRVNQLVYIALNTYPRSDPPFVSKIKFIANTSFTLILEKI